MRRCAAGEAYLRTGECDRCQAGTYLSEPACTPTQCLECPLNSKCYGGSQFGPAPSFWRESAESFNMHACYNPSACLGAQETSLEKEANGQFKPEGKCAPHYTGQLCSECEEGFSRNSLFECARCPPLAINLILSLLLGVLSATLMGLLIWTTVRSMARPRSLFSSYVRLLASHLQQLALLASFRFDWPQEVAQLLAAFSSVADAPSQLLSLDCLLSSLVPILPRFYSWVLLYSVLLPAFGLLSLGFVAWVDWPCSQPSSSAHAPDDPPVPRRRRAPCGARFRPAALVFLFLVHPGVTQTLFQLFNCVYIEGEPRLVEALSQECWTGRHLSLAASVGALWLAMWVVGLPLGTGLMLREKAAQLANSGVKPQLGFLYAGFTRRTYFWEVLSMARKEAVAALSTFLVPYGTTVQALLLLALLLMSLLLQLRLRPYETPLLNSLETASLAALLVSVFAGLFFLGHREEGSPFYRPGTDFALSSAMRWLLFFVVLLINFWFFLRLSVRLLGHARVKVRLKYPRFYLACCLCFSRRLL